MLRISKLFISTLLCSLILVSHSCRNTKNNTNPFGADEPEANDTISLRIAVLPVKECDILSYAQESGLASSMGLAMTLIPYDAMMDMDTAILSDIAHVYFEDSLRICRIKEDYLRPRMILPIPVKLVLMAGNDTTIKDVTDLKTNMVGLCRWSQAEEWMNRITSSSDMDEMDVYHAQINSIPLRFSMVREGLIDAAIMPQPWADSLWKQGHMTLRDTIVNGMGFYISAKAEKDTIRQKQALLLKKVYLEAIKQTTTTQE